jgi:hypothetical protein
MLMALQQVSEPGQRAVGLQRRRAVSERDHKGDPVAPMVREEAVAAELGPLKKISGASPFTNCSADQVGSQPGLNYPQSEIEPWVDANPAEPRNLIVAWQQDRWSNGGARGLVSAYTQDGGATWHTVLLPKVTACTGGTYKRASDPWVSIAPNGTAYFMSLAFDPNLPSGSFGRNAMLVSRSANGGQSWSNPITLIQDPDGQVLNDKNSLTADDTNFNYAYAVWDRLQDFTVPPAGSAVSRSAAVKATAGTGDGVVAARERMQQLRRLAAAAEQPTEVFFKGPTYFARTTNGGQTWEKAREVYDPGPNSQTIANQIVVPPSGAVIDFFTEISPNGGTRIGLVRSFDKGTTFRGPQYAATIATVRGIVTPDTQEPVRDASILFDVAVDPNNGNLYLVWQDVRFSGFDEVAFSTSTDGGLNWSPPIRINKTPRSSNELRQQAFVPSIEVGPSGKLVATYYDFRFDKNDGREAADHWAVLCDPSAVDCRKASSWAVELRLTSSSFNILKAPVAGGYFLGDYMGLSAAETRVFPVFGIVDGERRTSIFTRPIGLGGAGLLAEVQ